MIFLGSGENGSWTESDWIRYGGDKDNFWSGGSDWPDADSPSVDRFAAHVDRLASYYSADEDREFVKAFGLIYASFPYGRPFSSLASMAQTAAVNARFSEFPPLNEGEAGWRPQLNEHNQAHHYAGLFYVGYFYGSRTGITVNWARGGRFSGLNQADIYLGDIASRNGWALRQRQYSVSGVGEMIRVNLSDRDYLLPQNWYPE
ncbi:MAG: hypothetical protein ACK5NN_04260 [Sphingomonadaceae bacterium]